MPNVWHYIIFYPVGLLEEMPTSHKQLTKSHPPGLVEPLRRKGGALNVCAYELIMRRRRASLWALFFSGTRRKCLRTQTSWFVFAEPACSLFFTHTSPNDSLVRGLDRCSEK